MLSYYWFYWWKQFSLALCRYFKGKMGHPKICSLSKEKVEKLDDTACLSLVLNLLVHSWRMWATVSIVQFTPDSCHHTYFQLFFFSFFIFDLADLHATGSRPILYSFCFSFWLKSDFGLMEIRQNLFAVSVVLFFFFRSF